MKTILQLGFFVFIFVIYILSFFLLWLGFYPGDVFAEIVSKWALVTPFVALLAPLLSFVVFVLGYDPRVTWLQRIRVYLLSLLQATRPLVVTLSILLLIAVIHGLWLSRLLARPAGESFRLLMNGDFERAAELAEGKEASYRSARLIWLVAEAEIEAKRKLSTSDNPTEMTALQKELSMLDTSFAPLWHRYLARYGLGRLAFCRKDLDGIDLHFERAARMSRWFDSSMPESTKRAQAENIFSLSREEADSARSKQYVEKAKMILQDDFSIPSQRLLGSIYYVEGDFGGAFRTWQAILDRDIQTRKRGLELPDSVERKKLQNNMALARLQQSQPSAALKVVEKGLLEPWDGNLEPQRTEQVRLLSTKVLCLLALNRPADALKVFEDRTQISDQLRDEGVTTGSLLLKANILAANWRLMAGSNPNRKKAAEEILHCLLLAQDPKRDVHAFTDHSTKAYGGLIAEVKTLWRWNGIIFDENGCKQAIFSLIR